MAQTIEFTTLPAEAAERRVPTENELIAKDFPPLRNNVIVRAALRQDVPHVPVWVMRQAGRYLPEFMKVSEGIDFFTRCRTPEIACQLTLQPLVRYHLDAAIIFSDILVIPQALGLECLMLPGSGPSFPNPINTPADLDRLNPDVDVHQQLGYVFKAITVTRHRLNGHVPLIGFAGAPWTLFAYMIEGKGSKTWDKAKTWLYVHPEASHRLLKIITDATIRYLVGQVHAGAQLLQVFDSWAGSLSRDLFRTFALPCLARIASGVKAALGDKAVPMICFAKGAHWAIKELESTDYDVQGLDETADPTLIRPLLKGRVALQGNLDPATMHASDEVIRQGVAKMMSGFGRTGHIANLGHGMTPTMEPRCVKAFVDAVHEYSTASPVVRIGTRSSVLAMWQTRWALDRLAKSNPGVRFTVVKITSDGDANLTLDLDKFGKTGVFTDALEQALLAKEVDVLVHSLKDMPSTLKEGTALAAIGPREDPRDVLVFHPKHAGCKSLAELPANAVIGTSSARRRAQLAVLRPDINFRAVRGNVMTRLRKLDDDSEGYDALCLAAAGLKRLHLDGRISAALSTEDSLHAIGQGAIGIQVLSEDQKVLEMCHKSINDATTELVCKAERAFLRNIGGGCSLPIAVRSNLQDGKLTLTGLLASMDGSKRSEATMADAVTTIEEAERLGLALCNKVLEGEGQSILAELRKHQHAQ